MKNLIIVNAGGFGRTVFWQCNADYGHGTEWMLKGFLDDRANALDGFATPRPILGSPFSYEPHEDDIFLCAIGDPAQRRKFAAPLLAKGVEFINLCTEVAYPPSAKLGQGIIFERKVHVGSDSTIGDFATFMSMSIVGHDVVVSDYAHVGPFVFIGARVRIGPEVTIHPHSTILPGITIGDGAVVGAGSVVMRDVPAHSTVFGNPAKVIFKR